MAQTIDINAVRLDWQSRGFSCDVWTDPPGQVWEDYRHSVDEVVMVLEGAVEFDIAGKGGTAGTWRGSADSSRCLTYRAKPRHRHLSMAVRLQDHQRLIRKTKAG